MKLIILFAFVLSTNLHAKATYKARAIASINTKETLVCEILEYAEKVEMKLKFSLNSPNDSIESKNYEKNSKELSIEKHTDRGYYLIVSGEKDDPNIISIEKEIVDSMPKDKVIGFQFKSDKAIRCYKH